MQKVFEKEDILKEYAKIVGRASSQRGYPPDSTQQGREDM